MSSHRRETTLKKNNQAIQIVEELLSSIQMVHYSSHHLNNANNLSFNLGLILTQPYRRINFFKLIRFLDRDSNSGPYD